MSGTTNWAQRQKEALAATKANEGFTEVGGGGGNITFYNFKPSDRPNTKVLSKGDSVVGTYLGSPIGKKFGNPYHKLQTSEGTVALPSAGQLNKKIADVAVGTEIKVVYDGMETIKTGPRAGKDAHNFKLFVKA